MAQARAGAFFQQKGVRDAFRILAWVPVGIFFTRHVYSLASVTGGSMQPTFNPNLSSKPLHHDVVLLERWSVALNRFRKGDVVTLWSPQNPDLLTTKRIIALEGDLVHPLPPSPPTPVRIPPGHCWVEGDSKYQTRDSNTYGPRGGERDAHQDKREGQVAQRELLADLESYRQGCLSDVEMRRGAGKWSTA
ncbi:mitochondrial inner membrane protease subunit 2 [Kwoniella heveanensis CBS 569]|nr:mitochondrial inner membrane protease subunit 2 [Kwoniella heveanensis CBS 569]